LPAHRGNRARAAAASLGMHGDEVLSHANSPVADRHARPPRDPLRHGRGTVVGPRGEAPCTDVPRSFSCGARAWHRGAMRVPTRERPLSRRMHGVTPRRSYRGCRWSSKGQRDRAPFSGVPRSCVCTVWVWAWRSVATPFKSHGQRVAHPRMV
jgi:hypothetical protein